MCGSAIGHYRGCTVSDATQWIDAYLNDELSAEDAESFRQWLRSDRENVDAFVRHARLHWQLRDVLAGAEQPVSFAAVTSTIDPVTTRTRSGGPWVRRTWLAAAAVVTLCLLGSLLFRLVRKAQSVTGCGSRHEQHAGNIDFNGSCAVGRPHGPGGGAVHRGSCWAEIWRRRLSGFPAARGGVEGCPCEFDVVSRAAGRLSRGQLVATVPPSAKGFRVDTPSIAVVDLGTRFGLVGRPVGEQRRARASGAGRGVPGH